MSEDEALAGHRDATYGSDRIRGRYNRLRAIQAEEEPQKEPEEEEEELPETKGGPFSIEEDDALLRGVARHGVGSWTAILREEKALSGRNGDQVRRRFLCAAIQNRASSKRLRKDGDMTTLDVTRGEPGCEVEEDQATQIQFETRNETEEDDFEVSNARDPKCCRGSAFVCVSVERREKILRTCTYHALDSTPRT